MKFLVLKTLMLLCSIYCKVDVIRDSTKTKNEGNYMKLVDLPCKLESIKVQSVTDTYVLLLTSFFHQYQAHTTPLHFTSKKSNIHSS